MKSEFLISGIETGQLNAMVKNIMLQTGIKDPEEAVRMLNAGELNVTKIAILRKLYSISEDGSKIENSSLKDGSVFCIYELTRQATFSEMFNFLDRDLNEICFTRNQVIGFCENHKEHLLQTGSTFFLFKENNEFFVAKARVDSDGLHFRIFNFSQVYIWKTENVHHLVVPVYVR